MRFAPFLLALVCTIVLFTGLDLIGVTDQREARDAQVARELIEAKEPLTPLLGMEPWLEKPILAFAPEAAIRLLWRSSGDESVPGREDRVSRRFRAAAGVLLVIVIASIGAQWFGLRAGWFAALATVTSLVLPYSTRVDGTQLLATLLAWVGCAGFADALFGRKRGRDLRLVVAYGALAVALIVAGPLPALWPFLALAIYLRLSRTRGGWSRLRIRPGLCILLGAALPWYGAMIERHGREFLAQAPFFPYAAAPHAAWWAGVVLMSSLMVIGLFPWSSLLPVALQHAGTMWRRPRRRALAVPGAVVGADPVAREHREERAAHFFVACLIAALLPVLFYPFPPLSAALPALPAAALLCARFLDHLFEDPERVARPFTRSTLMLALLGTAGALLLTVLARYVREAAPELRLVGTVTFAASWMPFLANFLGRRRVAAVLMALPVALGAPLVAVRLLPRMEGYLGTREVAEAMTTVAPPHATLVLVDQPPPSLRYYTRRNLSVVDADPFTRITSARNASSGTASVGDSVAASIDTVAAERRSLAGSEADAVLASAFERHRSTDGLAYVAFRPSREREIARAASGPLEILIRTPTLVLARIHR